MDFLDHIRALREKHKRETNQPDLPQQILEDYGLDTYTTATAKGEYYWCKECEMPVDSEEHSMCGHEIYISRVKFFEGCIPIREEDEELASNDEVDFNLNAKDAEKIISPDY